MPASLRELRARIRSVEATKKLTRAMELIAASRIVKAQQRTREAAPYARELTRAVSAVATYSNVEHPLTSEPDEAHHAAVLVVTSDRGQAGAYSANALRQAGRLCEALREDGKEPHLYVVGRKGVGYYRFRERPVEKSWTGFTDTPTYDDARTIGDTLIDAFVADSDTPGGALSVDEVHVVYTRFKSMLVQEATDARLLPLEVVEGTELPDAGEVLPLYDFEPGAAEVLDALLPRYVESRLFDCLLQSSASELAARQRAMKAATDNAEELVKKYTRDANQMRQAGITQEISEIVGGVNALADANSGSE